GCSLRRGPRSCEPPVLDPPAREEAEEREARATAGRSGRDLRVLRTGGHARATPADVERDARRELDPLPIAEPQAAEGTARAAREPLSRSHRLRGMSTNQQLQLVSIRETADALGVGVSTIRAWIRAGRLPAVKVGGQIRLDPADVAAFVEPVHPPE